MSIIRHGRKQIVRSSPLIVILRSLQPLETLYNSNDPRDEHILSYMRLNLI